MSGKRVLVVGINFAPEPTGIAPYTSALCSGLGARGFCVDVVTTYPHYPEWRVRRDFTSGALRTSAASSGLRRLRHYVPRDPTGARRALSEASFGVGAMVQPWGSPDVVICPSPALISTAFQLVRARVGQSSAALGVVVQDLYSAGATQVGGYGGTITRALTAVERAVLCRADGVVAIHDRFKRTMIDELSVAPDRIDVIRNWTHVGRPMPERREITRRGLRWRAGEVIVLHTGAMGEKQDLRTVVDAARLADQQALPVRFVLMGDGGQRRALEEASVDVRRLDVMDPVAEDDYLDVLVAADILLVNERRGVSDVAVPSKLTSYFSSGNATLAATEPGSTTADEVRASGAGVVTGPGNPATLLDAAMRLAADAPLQAEMGRKGAAYCAKVLSEEAALDAYAEWVERLIHRRRRARA